MTSFHITICKRCVVFHFFDHTLLINLNCNLILGGLERRDQEAHKEEMVDLHNYKGIYFEDENEKYQCPVTGAHFKFDDLCARMERIRVKRGDPLVEFDSKGNKIYVKSVALPKNGVV